jgi:hypothetical protein
MHPAGPRRIELEIAAERGAMFIIARRPLPG